jgi:fucose permease
VEHKAFAADQAARIMIFYFVGFTLGRLLSGVFASKLSCWKLIRTGMAVMGIGMALLLLPLPGFMAGIALFLIGMGNSPLFPNFTYLAPRNFGADISQSVIGSQMAASNTGFLVTPLLCSLLGQWLSMGVFPVYLAALFLCLLLGVANIQKTMKAAGKDIQ